MICPHCGEEFQPKPLIAIRGEEMKVVKRHGLRCYVRDRQKKLHVAGFPVPVLVVETQSPSLGSQIRATVGATAKA